MAIKITYKNPKKGSKGSSTISKFNQKNGTFTLENGAVFSVETGKEVTGHRIVTGGLDKAQIRFDVKYGRKDLPAPTTEKKKKVSKLGGISAPKPPKEKKGIDFRIRLADSKNLVPEVYSPVKDPTTKEVVGHKWRPCGYYSSIEGCCRGILCEISNQQLGKRNEATLNEIIEMQEEIKNLLLTRFKEERPLIEFVENQKPAPAKKKTTSPKK